MPYCRISHPTQHVNDPGPRYVTHDYIQYWSREGYIFTLQPEPSPQPTNPSSEGSWIVSDSPSPEPPPIPPYQRTRGLEIVADTLDEEVFNWRPVEVRPRASRPTSSARSGTQEGGATASPALRQTLKRDGNTFKKFIQKTMNTESS